MSIVRNHVQLDWAVDAIQVGVRHRRDYGDLDGLAESIDRIGLLQLITITTDGVLVCGARRLAAVKQLGWRTVNVWVTTGLSDGLTALMAERDDHATLKPYTTLEMADLYEELKNEIAADASRRQQATRFGADEENPLSDGAANFAAPHRGEGDTRKQAADMVGGASYTTLDKIVELRQLAGDATHPLVIRDAATDALQQIEAGERVDGLYCGVKALVRTAELSRIATDEEEHPDARRAAREGLILLEKLEHETPMTPAEKDKAARAALQRSKAARPKALPAPSRPVESTGPRLRPVVSFIHIWDEMKDWPHEYDPQAVAHALTDAQWEQFQKTVADTITFTNQVAEARANR